MHDTPELFVNSSCIYSESSLSNISRSGCEDHEVSISVFLHPIYNVVVLPVLER